MKFGDTVNRSDKVDTVVLEEDERIIGVIARPFTHNSNVYSDFAFQIEVDIKTKTPEYAKPLKNVNLIQEFLKNL
jgi:hypothetical protein